MAEAQVIQFPADERIGSERSDLVTQAVALAVIDQESADHAGKVISAIRSLRKRVAETFDPIVEAAHKAHRMAIAKRTEHDGPLANAEVLLKSRIGEWGALEERKRREEAARLAAEARRRDEEQRLAEAEALEAAGENEAADRALEAPPLPPPAPAATIKPKVAGVSMRQVWHVEVSDLGALVKAIAEGKAALACIRADEGAIKKLVDATAGQTVPPGVRAWQAPAVAARGR
jgi:hypothetical protein